MDYIKNIRSLPVPTPDQIERFKKHLLTVHSWYKHLPLIEGGTFTIYMEPDLDREYPSIHPKLPFGNTKEGYLSAFGHLAYQYRIDGHWHQDFKDRIINGVRVSVDLTSLPDIYKEKWSFQLYPYCHPAFEEAYSLFEKDLKKLREKKSIPNAELLQNWIQCMTVKDYLDNNQLHCEERMTYENENERFTERTGMHCADYVFRLPVNMSEDLRLTRKQREIERELRALESEKVENTLRILINDLEELKGGLV